MRRCSFRGSEACWRCKVAHGRRRALCWSRLFFKVPGRAAPLRAVPRKAALQFNCLTLGWWAPKMPPRMRTGFHLRLHRLVFLRAVLPLAVFAILPAGEAQTPDSQILDRSELLRTQTPLRDDSASDESGTDDTHAVASPNDPDLGEQAILKRSEKYQPFTVAVSAPFSYTSNAALTSRGEKDDILFTPAVGVSFTPRITNTFFASVSVGQQYFYYDRFPDLDFGSFDARAGLSYLVPKLHNLLLRADYDYNRLTSDDGFDEFFSQHSLTFGAELPFRIGRAQQISVGTDLSFSLAADPDQPARHDFSAFAAYSVNLTRALTLSGVARLAVRDYVEGDRTDVSGIFALSVNYAFTKWLSASASSTFATNDSNQDVFDYDVANLGAALSLAFKF